MEAIERVGAETFIYGTRQHEIQGVAANPGELPPGEVIVRIPGAVAPAIGEQIRAVAPREKLHLFSADGAEDGSISEALRGAGTIPAWFFRGA